MRRGFDYISDCDCVGGRGSLRLLHIRAIDGAGGCLLSPSNTPALLTLDIGLVLAERSEGLVAAFDLVLARRSWPIRPPPSVEPPLPG